MRILRAHPGPLLGVAAFAALALVLTLMVAGTLAGDSGTDRTRLRAQFRDATGLAVGDDVRIAGVRVGRVVDTELVDGLALVTFEVDGRHVVDTGTTATIGYLNLMGERYVDLAQGTTAEPRPLRAGETIPVARTRPALDLGAMFNAFRPLFDALAPEDLNELAGSVVQALQGQGATVGELTHQVAALTQHLAGRDEVIGRVLDNLTLVLTTADEHRTEITDLIGDLGGLARGLAQDRRRLGFALTDASTLAVLVEDLADRADDPLVNDLVELRRLTENLAAEAPLLGRFLTAVPMQFAVYLRTLGYGSHLNVYVCTLRGQLPGLPAVDSFPGNRHTERCR
ncbi:MCE family protein [Nocardioides daejeonensis]|uniref:MCE family protein n=1 Tax=Nocardioides daejeonensis TaxID=1046556 RepID=UPI000D7494C2|nr:MCE family protein [Nocardioides daejeonensis]